MIEKPRGGRGKRLSYRTIPVRIPEPLLDLVNQLSDIYRQTENLTETLKSCQSFLETRTGIFEDKIRLFYQEWSQKSSESSQTNPRWQKARQMLEELSNLLR